MTFAVSAALGQETIGVRMEFLAQNTDIRADALYRLQHGANPIGVAQTLTDGTKYIDVFGEDNNSFVGKLNDVLGGGAAGAAAVANYQAVVAALAPAQQDTPPNREHVLTFWQRAIAMNPVLADQIRNVFIQALKAAGPVQVRWGQPAVTHNAPGTAEYNNNGEVVMTVNPGHP